MRGVATSEFRKPNYMKASINRQSRPENLDLANWRLYPQSNWAFQNVRELMPTANIRCAIDSVPIGLEDKTEVLEIKIDSGAGKCSLIELLEQNYGDALLILHDGKVVAEWYAPYYHPNNPHVLFSVSKSLTGLLAGIMEDKGMVDCEAPVVDYLPQTKLSAYGDCTVRHLLDMSVALDFEENYTDSRSEYVKYRIATGWNPVDQTRPGPGLESFLYGLQKSSDEHGRTFLYRSPNTDLLGLVLEKVGRQSLAALFSQLLWRPMGADSDAYITLDRYGAPRAAGGVCVTLRDLVRIGQLFLDAGRAGDKKIVSPRWLEDTFNNGDQAAWDRGNYKQKFPRGNYRNQWYQIGDEDGSISARGIHGQLLYVNPTRSVVIAKFASQPEPLSEQLTAIFFKAFDTLAKYLEW